jgi:predicted transcriptional regulator
MKTTYDLKAIKNSIKLLQIVSREISQSIINLLSEKGEMAVTGIFTQLNLRQAAVSLALLELRKYGIVQPDRRGHFVYYSINEQQLNKVINLSSQINEA